MRRFRWLPWVRASLVAAGANMLLGTSIQAGSLDEARVQRALLQRFDENRNDKLDSGEARQARSRLRNLIEVRTEGEINIVTWRDDVRELLQAIDQDNDNRLTGPERDAGRTLLESLIPHVDPQIPKDRAGSSTSSGREKGSDRAPRSNRGPSSGGIGYSDSGYVNRSFGGAMGGGGFGNSLGRHNFIRTGTGNTVQSGVIGSTAITSSNGLPGATSNIPSRVVPETGKKSSIEGPLNDTPSRPVTFSNLPSLGVLASGGSETSLNPQATTKPGVPTKETASSGSPGTKPDGLPSGTKPPDGLGGGINPPRTDGPPAAPGQTTTVPFIAKPNF